MRVCVRRSHDVLSAQVSAALATSGRTLGERHETCRRRTPEGTLATLRGGVTTYSDTDYEELFAESFLPYVSDWVRLQQLRPNAHACCRRRYP